MMVLLSGDFDDFATVIPTTQILSASIFDIELYDKHFKEEQKEKL